MKRSFLSFAVLACMAMASSCASAVARVERYAHAFAVLAVGWCRSVVESFKAVVATLPGPTVALVRGAQYVARQVRRERPRYAAQWRMCPSA